MAAALRAPRQNRARDASAHLGGALLVRRVKGEAQRAPGLLHRVPHLLTLMLVSHNPDQFAPPSMERGLSSQGRNDPAIMRLRGLVHSADGRGVAYHF